MGEVEELIDAGDQVDSVGSSHARGGRIPLVAASALAVSPLGPWS